MIRKGLASHIETNNTHSSTPQHFMECHHMLQMLPPEPETAIFPGHHVSRAVALHATSVDAAVEQHSNSEESHDASKFDDGDVPMETGETPTHGSQADRKKKPDTVHKKAPGAPKRFKSSYVHFFTHFVEKKKQELGPDGLPIKLDISSVSKESSQAWKELPSDQRKYWDAVSEEEKHEYNKQKQAYKGPWRIAATQEEKKGKGPKRPPSAFFLFVNAKRPAMKAEYPDMATTEVVKACSEMWRELDGSEKAPFKEEEEKLRAQYHVEAEKWKKQNEENEDPGKAEGGVNGVTVSGKFPAKPAPRPGLKEFFASGHVPHHVVKVTAAAPTHRKKQKRDPNAPKRSPPAFFLFVNHCRPELKMQFPELRHTELVKMLGQKWAEMSDEEQRPFRDREEILRQQYHADTKRYRKGAVPEDEYGHLGTSEPVLEHPTSVHAPHPKDNDQQTLSQNHLNPQQSNKENLGF